MELWEHQRRAIESFWAAYQAGERRIVLCAPPRAGKTLIFTHLIDEAIARGMRVAVYTNRVMLREQTQRVFEARGIWHGVRAAGADPALLRDVQIASMQTEFSRVLRNGTWEVHDADIVFVDEAHRSGGRRSVELLHRHLSGGACICGVTATPVALSHLYTKLLQVAVASDLRKCGAILPCRTYGPSEIDVRGIKRNSLGEYSPREMDRRMMVMRLFGNVFDHYLQYNPDQLPAILFAPSVRSSVWFAQHFEQRGIKAAHIDGQFVYVDGHRYGSDRSARDDILARSKEGDIKVICNRYVLREGLDLPWLYHCIAATTFGSEHSFVQACSRIMNAYPGYTHVQLQCHGGSWWRYGSLNDDRRWTLDGTRSESKPGEPPDRKPLLCPKCKAVRRGGPVCPYCGHEHKVPVRFVMMSNGSLRPMSWREAPLERSRMQELRKHWFGAYYSALRGKSNKTMKQVMADYRRRSNCAPFPFRSDGTSPWTQAPRKDSELWNLRIQEYEAHRQTGSYGS